MAPAATSRPMRFVASRRAVACALALCAALAPTAPRAVHAFAPAPMKGRACFRPPASAVAAEAVAAATAPASPTVPQLKGGESPRTSPGEERSAKKKRGARRKRSAKKKQGGRASSADGWRDVAGFQGKGAPKAKPQRKNGAAKGQQKAVEGRRKAPERKRKASGKMQDRRKPLKDLKLGSTISGTVVGVTRFGAFLRTEYATRGAALLHISQISNERIRDVNDRFAVGDRVDGLRVLTVDARKGAVGLSLRPPRPKRRGVDALEVGDEIEGRVVQVVSYGVFVDVGVNVNALLHISRITGGRIDNIRLYLNEGDPVSVHVINTDPDKKTVAVSMLDKNADRYLDKRMRLRREKEVALTEARKTELQYFDQVVKELEQAVEEKQEGAAA